MIHNIVVTGIGGQGVTFASTLLRQAIGLKFGRFAGYDDRSGAQRFGHVSSVIRFSLDRSYRGPLALDLPDRQAQWAIALEATELIRFSGKLAVGAVVIMDRCVVVPTNVRRVDGPYPRADEVAAALSDLGCSVDLRDLRAVARGLTGSPVDANLVALGLFAQKSGGLLSPVDLEPVAPEREMSVIRHGFALPPEEPEP
ncbi:MAG: 2-oxoacid:acceptor oxidoreductase family protein [Candidatus Riflebacteria bacterium]|nr:2-oxoacid:acceptor oxidoreductase family protein [Candidatus Riflebacteria bacterium]